MKEMMADLTYKYKLNVHELWMNALWINKHNRGLLSMGHKLAIATNKYPQKERRKQR